MYLKYEIETHEGFYSTTTMERVESFKLVRDPGGMAIVLNGRELDRVGNEYPNKKGRMLALYTAIERQIAEGKTLILYDALKSERGL